ncbi:MAG: hypothetical protein ACKVKF_20020 [Rhodobacterales bacterium]
MRVITSLFLLVMLLVPFAPMSAAQAAVMDGFDLLPQDLGVPLRQRFLPNGASIVTTRDTKSCVISRRIEIENSVYTSADGDALDFERIVRSPATSIQAISTAHLSSPLEDQIPVANTADAAMPDFDVPPSAFPETVLSDFDTSVFGVPRPSAPMSEAPMSDGTAANVQGTDEAPLGDMEVSETSMEDTEAPVGDMEVPLAPDAEVVAFDLPGETSFRIQMKYSPTLDAPISLDLGDRVMDLRDMMEISTDSLLITGEAAALLDAAFRKGVTPRLSAVSGDTWHHVTDSLIAPEMSTLDACKDELASDATTPQEVSNAVRVAFKADPATTPLATLPELRACRMNDAPGLLYLAKLEAVDGFFSQTNNIFVSFNEDGTVARAYIPGIFDSNFSDGIQSARLSLAANSNVPSEPNDVKGCRGEAELQVCSSIPEPGSFLIGPCILGDDRSMFPDATGFVPELGGLGPSLGGPGLAGASPANRGSQTFRRTGGGGGSPFPSPPPFGPTTPPTKKPPGGETDPPPPVVPLPASLILICSAFLALVALRRARGTGPTGLRG